MTLAGCTLLDQVEKKTDCGGEYVPAEEGGMAL